MRLVTFWLAMAAVWFALVGRFTVADAVYGTLVIASAWGLYLLTADPPAPGPLSGWRWGLCAFRFFGLYVGPEMVRSTLRVFRKVLSPALDLEPSLAQVALPGASRATLLALAYGLSLTPGQQVVGIDEDRCLLYIHTMDEPDPEAVRRQIWGLQQRFFKEERA